MAQLTAAKSQEVEREFVAHREAVLQMLRIEFRGLDDAEELYQDAWAEALELLARGETIRNPRALLKTIARRRALDRIRNGHTIPADPASQLIVGRPDLDTPVDEQAHARLDSVTLRQIVDDLAPREAAVIKLRFDEQRSASEIQESLGITAKRLEKVVAAAYRRVQANLEASGGETRWRRRQRSLLLACEIGWASAAQRARAQRMVDEDPVCRAMLREMRTTLREIAAVLPAPVFVEHDRLARVPATFWDRLAVAREQIHDLFVRSPVVEQAGSAVAGGAGTSVAVKAALACVFAAGGTVACVESGLLDQHPRPAKERTTSTPRRTTPPPEPRPPIVATGPSRKSTRSGSPRRSSASSGSRSASAPPAPSPTRSGSTEFGPGAIGSSSASTQPAAAPSGGGGEFLP